MTAALTVLYAVGALAALAFLVVHRPRRWARAAAFNAAGWIVVAAATFVRGLVLIALHGGARRPDSALDAGISLGLLAAVDALVLLRLISYARFRDSEEPRSEDRGSAARGQ